MRAYMCARHVLSDAHAQQSAAEFKATLEALRKEFDSMKSRDGKGVRMSLYALACVCIMLQRLRTPLDTCESVLHVSACVEGV